MAEVSPELRAAVDYIVQLYAQRVKAQAGRAQSGEVSTYKNIVGMLQKDPNIPGVIQTAYSLADTNSALDKFWDTSIQLYKGTSTHTEEINKWLTDTYKQYESVTGKTAAWKAQSQVAMGMGTGRRPTILTSGRGAAGTPAMALTKLKKQLGK